MAERSSPEQGPEEMESAVSLLWVEEEHREISLAGQSRWTRSRVMIGAAVGLAAAAALAVALRRGAAATEGAVGDATELWHDQAANRPFDCNAGFANWKIGWSSPKQEWCCDHVGRGCEFRRDNDFDIPTGWGNSPYHGVHGHTGSVQPYDCNAGYANWRAGWAVEKKDWCCSHTGHGCNPGPYHQQTYPSVYHPIHDRYIVHHADLCSYHVGDDVKVQSRGEWLSGRVLGRAGSGAYRVMLEERGEETTVACFDIQSGGGAAVYPAAIWVLVIISLLAIIIGLWATFGKAAGDGH